MKASPLFHYSSILLTSIVANAITSPVVSGFSSISPPQAGKNSGIGCVPNSNDKNYSRIKQAAAPTTTSIPQQSQQSSILTSMSSTSSTSETSISSWRLVLDIGREPLVTTSPIPFDWGRSGCRMPLVIPVDFVLVQGADNSIVVPRSDTVSFTGENGAVTSPVHGGTWKVVDNPDDEKKKPQSLSFSLHFPESFSRRDVVIEGDTTITLEGAFYTKTAIDLLNDDFYQAREETWELGKQLNDMSRRHEAPKKWNEEKKRWEKRYPTENLMTQVTKRMQLFKAQTNQNIKNSLRPNPNTLSSTFGTLPGVMKSRSNSDDRDGNEDDRNEKEPIYMLKQGTVKIGNSVIGRWSAEPIKELNY